MSLEKLKSDILELIKTDEEFRLALIGALSAGLVTREETNRILSEIKKLREDFNKQLEAFKGRMDAFERRMEELREDFNRGMRSFDIKLSSLSVRWGIMSESAFRNALRGLLSEKFGVKVSRWETFDKDGIVYGKPSMVDIDLMIKDKEHFLVEIKSHVRKSDVAELLRISKLYEKIEKIKPSLIIVTPFIEEKAKEFAETN